MYQVLITRKTKRQEGNIMVCESHERLRVEHSNDYSKIRESFEFHLKEELNLISTIDYSTIHSTIELVDYDTDNKRYTIHKVITLQNF